jgi:hypothetical protein
MRSSAIRRARSMGMAKPIPAFRSPRIAVFTPTSRPSMSRSAPPEFPGLIDASVWTKSKSVRSPALKLRFTAETTPVVTVCERPKGFPMAITVSPMRRSSERPIVANGSRSFASSFRTARSEDGSVPTTLASSSRPSRSPIRKRAPRSTTWAFVRTQPSGETMTPEPSEVTR